MPNVRTYKVMQNIFYTFVVGNIMYAQVCMCPNIAYITGMLGRYLSNPGFDTEK
jgi:hypothetical protein